MLMKRVIPCLDVHEGRVVKGVNFVNLRDAGDPVEMAAIYDKAGADEVGFLDITATHEERPCMLGSRRGPPRSASSPTPSVAGCVGRRHPRDAQGRRRQDLAELGGGTQPRADRAYRADLRRPVHRHRDRRADGFPAPVLLAGRSSSTADASTPRWTL